jgi:hypothetical protein
MPLFSVSASTTSSETALGTPSAILFGTLLTVNHDAAIQVDVYSSALAGYKYLGECQSIHFPFVINGSRNRDRHQDE